MRCVEVMKTVTGDSRYPVSAGIAIRSNSGVGTVSDEHVTSDDTQRDTYERRRRATILPGIVLLAAFAVVVWLIITYAQRPSATSNGVVSAPVTVSSTIPDVVGLTEDDAVRMLSDAGFSVSVDTSFDVLARAGTVSMQEPGAGRKAAPGATVVIAVAVDEDSDEFSAADAEAGGGGTAVPDVRGLTRSGAESALDNSGLEIAVTRVYSTEQPQGVVFEQVPSPDARVAGGATVQVLLSLGAAPPGTARVPNVVGMREASALRRIRAAGLDPRPMYQPKLGRIGEVYEQSPSAGSRLELGSKMFVLIGSMD